MLSVSMFVMYRLGTLTRSKIDRPEDGVGLVRR